MSKDLKKVKEIAMGMYRKDIVGTGNSQYEDLAVEAFLICLRNIKDASVVGMSERTRGKVTGSHYVVLWYPWYHCYNQEHTLYFSKCQGRKW